jgi:hypothetical protein
VVGYQEIVFIGSVERALVLLIKLNLVFDLLQLLELVVVDLF